MDLLSIHLVYSDNERLKSVHSLYVSYVSSRLKSPDNALTSGLIQMQVSFVASASGFARPRIRKGASFLHGVDSNDSCLPPRRRIARSFYL